MLNPAFHLFLKIKYVDFMVIYFIYEEIHN